MPAKGRTAFFKKAGRLRATLRTRLASFQAACVALLLAAGRASRRIVRLTLPVVICRILRQVVRSTLPVALCLTFVPPAPCAAGGFMLRIYERQSGKLYVEVPAEVNSRLFFGWIHSQEQIPWNEYYHVDEQGRLVLDAVTFPAFGAGIPENAGRVCYVRDGLIHMEEIDRPFDELDWLNSHTATRDIRIDDKLVARGADLPRHARMRLVMEKAKTSLLPPIQTAPAHPHASGD